MLAADSGMLSEFGLETGDIIRSFRIGRDGETVEYEVNRTFDISDILFVLRPGDTITVIYDRDSRTNISSTAVTLSSSDFISIA